MHLFFIKKTFEILFDTRYEIQLDYQSIILNKLFSSPILSLMLYSTAYLTESSIYTL